MLDELGFWTPGWFAQPAWNNDEDEEFQIQSTVADAQTPTFTLKVPEE